jgi:hypothetical protein
MLVGGTKTLVRLSSLRKVYESFIGKTFLRHCAWENYVCGKYYINSHPGTSACLTATAPIASAPPFQ